MRSRPPRVARWIVERALPRDVRDDVTGDLDEMFRRTRERRGPLRARLWYWRQTLSFSGHFLRERWRDRRVPERTGEHGLRLRLSAMDLRLALRILARYPGLTIVAVLGMAVGITISAGAFAILYTFMNPALPLDEGERIVQIQNWDTERNRPERRILSDLAAWRTELSSFQDVGGFRQIPRNLIVSGSQPETVRVTEISAAGFRVPRIPPLLGRHLVDADERRGAAPVVVIAADIWRNRFASDPAIVGRAVQLGDKHYTIVGVMPDGFAFPVNDRIWVPLRVSAEQQPRTGPSITVFGRLAPGATFDSAQAELSAVGARAAAISPESHGRLRPTVAPYTFPFFDLHEPTTGWLVHLMQFLISLLLVVVCVNVAILVYARTATRQGEIAVRTALGASRGRIVSQLFVEAFALAIIAAAVGLVLTSIGLRQVNAAMVEAFAGVPFWWKFEVSPGVVAYAAGLSVFAAAIVGIVPALKATGRRVQSGLQQISAGGGGGMQFGRTWTALVVVQVAIAVALLPAAVFHAWDSLRVGLADPGTTTREVLTFQLTLDRTDAPSEPSDQYERVFAARYAGTFVELTRQLETEPLVTAVTFASSVPGEEPTAWIDVDGVPSPNAPVEDGGWVATGTGAGHEVRFNRVGIGYFDAFDVPLLTGRYLQAADVEATGPHQANVSAGVGGVVVNESFVRGLLGDSNPLGRHIRYVGVSNDAESDDEALGRWYEIVGVVGDFPAKATSTGLSPAKLYHAADAGWIPGAVIAVRVPGTEPAAFSGRVRELSAKVDPNLQIRNVATLDTVLRSEQRMMQVVAAVLAALTISVLVLASAGIYALMSFTVSQRRKEIGIRAALGADPARIFRSIFSRAFWQVSAGALLGGTIAAVLEMGTEGGLMQGHGAIVLPIVAVVMMCVGMLAALGPARRGLRIHPTDALREQ